MKKGLATAILLSGTALTACSLAPDYKTPETPSPAAFKEVGDWAKAQPTDEIPHDVFWKIFKDQELDALEDKVTNANQNLKIALAQYEEARAAVTVANADFYPTVTADSSATRQRLSGNVANRAPIKYYNDFLLGADTSYELDLWGRVRNAVTAATKEAEATKADLAGVALSLHAELAADYFALRGDDALQDVLDKTVDVDTKALDLVKDRYTGGIGTEADVDQAETQLENAKTQASDTRLLRAQLEHAIAVLTGASPGSFTLAPMALGTEAPPMTDPGMPSALLERRPDIAAAERRVVEANAEVGVARAAWFPTFSLTGAIGYESASPGTWLDAPSLFWSLGPSAALTLFDAGRISGLNDEARAAYDVTVATYRQTVLSAWQDVEDNLTALHHLGEENESADAAAKAAERALAQENNLYFGGAATYLDVSVAQNQALQAELALVSIRIRRMTADVQLIKALGGGWDVSEISAEKEKNE
jgi:NodT family efflux transporter outer membrane factor (OMF) lipoprotein